MAFLILSFVYFGIFSCIAGYLLTGTSSGFRRSVGDRLSRIYNCLVPTFARHAVEDILDFMFGSRNNIFTFLYVLLTLLTYGEWAYDVLMLLYTCIPGRNHVLLPICALFFNLTAFTHLCMSDPGIIPIAYTPSGTRQFVRKSQRKTDSDQKDGKKAKKEKKTESAVSPAEMKAKADAARWESKCRQALGLDIDPSFEFPFDGTVNVDAVYCGECVRERAARSAHCPLCQACIARFDHHCVFANNCVGLKNQRLFMLFLVSLITNTITLLYSFYCGVSAMVEERNLWDMKVVRQAADAQAQPMDMTFPLLVEVLFFEQPRLIATCFTLLFLTLWLVAYTAWHAYLISVNCTQRERRKLTYFGDGEKRKFSETYNRGFVTNWKEVLFARSECSTESLHLHSE